MASSTVPALKRALRDRLAARPALHDVQVSYGGPVPAGAEYVWVGDVEGEQEYGAMGPVMHEVYGVKVTFSVVREGSSTVEDADTRCFALFAELEDELRDDETVNGTVKNAHVGAFTLGEYVSPDALTRESRLTVTVNCEHWI